MVQNNSQLSLSCLVLALTGCDVDQHDHPDLVSGRALFEHHCAPCHKADGSGIFLKGVPASRETNLSVLQVMHKVQGHQEGERAMPKFKRMSQQEASKIAVYLKQLGKR